MNKIKETKDKLVKGLTNPDNKLSLIPNWLSASRAIGGIALPLMIEKNAPVKAIVGTVGSLAVTDFLDGKVARALNAESEEGALLDVVSDKIFSVSLIAGIAHKKPVFLINGALEGTISYINAKKLMNGEEPKSNMLGKLKIWPLSAALFLGYTSIVLQKHYNKNTKNIDKIATCLSLATIPLELINIVQYKNTNNPKQKKLSK